MTTTDVKKEVTKDSYFNKKKEIDTHFENNNNVNIKFYIHYHDTPEYKITDIKNKIQQAITNFKELYNLTPSTKEQIVKIYIFDDKDDYTHLGGKEHFNLGLGDEGGMYFPTGKIDTSPEIYLYQAGDIHNLKHEVTHMLMGYIAKDKAVKIPTALNEGIADYIKHHLDYKLNAKGFAIDETEKFINGEYLHLSINRNPDIIDGILELEYSNNEKENSLVYSTGLALVMYLKEEKPDLLKNYLGALNKGNVKEIEKSLNDIKQCDNAKFTSWLTANNTDTAMEAINALQVTKGDWTATSEEIVGNEIKKVSYYKANIETMDGKNVGEFSTIAYLGFGQYVRVNNKATDDCLDLSIKYHFLTLIKNSAGENTLTFVDENGNQYKNSKEYEDLVLHKMKYEFNLRNYSKSEIDNVMAKLIIVPVSSIKGTSNFTPQEGKIYSVKILGSGMLSALSIYDGETKYGELLSETGCFKQIEGQNEDTFFFSDDMKNMHSRYDEKAYLAVEKEGDKYEVSFLDGRIVNQDDHIDKPHLHKDELLSPATNHINKKDLDSLLIKDTWVSSHKNSALANYSEKQKSDSVIVEKGTLLDNKGSKTTDDDVHQANVKEKGNHLYEFKNMGYSITEQRTDSEGKIIDGSDFLIHDHGKNIRFQLPEWVDHLKLVLKDGVYKLVPSDKNGVEYVDIPDEYRYIDPIFAQQYEKRDYSHKLKDTGLIDFGQYKSGDVFAIKYDPDDYHVKRDAEGNIIRIKDQGYMTKVKLFYGNTEIGKLSNEFHNFKGDIFYSADFNYSHNDFLASVSPQIKIEKLSDESRKLRFEQGDGDIGDTDRGYTDHKQIFINVEKSSESTVRIKRAAEGEISQPREMQNGSEIQGDHNQNSSAVHKPETVMDNKITDNSINYNIVTDNTVMDYLTGGRIYTEKNNTEKSFDSSYQGAIQDVVITHEDMTKLYTRANGEEKKAVNNIWTKLHKSEYKIPFSTIENDFNKIDITTFISKMETIFNSEQKSGASYKMGPSDSYYVNNRSAVDSDYVNFEYFQYEVEVIDIIGTQQQESQYIA